MPGLKNKKTCRIKFPLLHTKPQDHRPFDSGKQDFKEIVPCMGMVAILLCDQDDLNKLKFPRPRKVPYQYDPNRPSDFRGENVRKC